MAERYPSFSPRRAGQRPGPRTARLRHRPTAADSAEQSEEDRPQRLGPTAGGDEHLLFEPRGALVLGDERTQAGFPGCPARRPREARTWHPCPSRGSCTTPHPPPARPDPCSIVASAPGAPSRTGGQGPLPGSPGRVAPRDWTRDPMPAARQPRRRAGYRRSPSRSPARSGHHGLPGSRDLARVGRCPVCARPAGRGVSSTGR